MLPEKKKQANKKKTRMYHISEKNANDVTIK